VFCNPFGACQMALIGPPCAPSVMIRIDVEDDPRNIAPVDTVCIGGKHPSVAYGVLFVVRCQRRYIWGGVGTIRIEQRALH